MWKCTLRAELAALLVVGLLGLAPDVPAQFNFNTNSPYMAGLTQAQYMAYLQQAAAARAAANQTLFPAGNMVNPYTPVTNPYTASGVNPYSPLTTPAYSPYEQAYMNPYLPYADAGSVLRGEADMMRAYGTVITSQEQARIIREQALQARLDTKKKKFDLDKYIRENTPTFTEEQAKIKKTILKRIQTNSTEPEILNGKALNFLLDDLRLHPGKKASAEPFALSGDVLGHVNVTRSGDASLGILRNSGEFTWPIVFPEYFPPEELKLIENQAKTLVRNADNGKSLDVNVLKDMRNELDKMREQLRQKINEIPTNQYLEGTRFLSDFDKARLALESGEASTQTAYLKWAAGGKDLQQLVDYMVGHGLRFTGATQGDEGAYRAIYSGMVALDVNLNTLLAPGASELPATTDPKEAAP